MHVTTRHLSPLATQLTGKQVSVYIGHDLGGHADGIATHDGTEYVIQLHPNLLCIGNMGRLAYVFLHECAHIALGHTQIRRQNVTNAQIAADVAQPLPRGYVLTGKYDRHESEAHEWAWSQVKNVPAWYVWELVTSE